METVLSGEPIVPGSGAGELLCADVGLSFWGGVDPVSGAVIDSRHPLRGQSVAGRVLAIPNGRGSCTGSQVILELLLGDQAPAAIVLRRPDEIIALGVIVAEELFGRSMPVVSVGEAGFARLLEHRGRVSVADALVALGDDGATTAATTLASPPPQPPSSSSLTMSADDEAMLEGRDGRAVQVAMKIVARMAALQRAPELIDISQVHIDGCTYIGPGSLRFAETMAAWGGRVRVPTTLNSGSVDRRKWRELGVPTTLGDPASALGDAYVAMGAAPSFTCAPYLLPSAPALGEHVAWGESNAVVYANSCLGARTQKYADFLDLCMALTGRAPRAGAHLDAARAPSVELRVSAELAAAAAREAHDADALWPTLGYLCGLRSEARVPLVTGLEALSPTTDDLKGFAAAFGTSASVPLFHLAGHTPEAAEAAAALAASGGGGGGGGGGDGGGSGSLDGSSHEVVDLGEAELHAAYATLDSGGADDVQLVSLGNPHFSLSEVETLASLLRGATKHDGVALVVTTGRQTLEAARAAGHAAELEAFGATLVSDTCWCMLDRPVVPPEATTLITNSAKYAHYAPGLVGCEVRFASLAGCAAAATTGRAPLARPAWLGGGGGGGNGGGRVGARAMHSLAPAARMVARAVLRRW